MSSPWNGPLLHFPGGKRYELVHRLGCVPREISVWESFDSQGVGVGSVAPSAGNMSLVQAVNDQTIRIKNDTCAEFYVLVTASCGSAQDAGTAEDGGSEAGADSAAE
jgi:hypothetical protein